MSILTSKLTGVERTVAHDLAAGHLSTQVLRFFRVTALTAVAQLLALGGGDLGWKAVAALLAGAAETAVRVVWPALPVARVAQAVQGTIKTAPTPAQPPAPPAGPTAG